MTLDAWTLEQIRDHIAAGLPQLPLFNIAGPETSAEQANVRLGPGEHVTLPRGSIVGPAQFVLTDVAIYALILAALRDVSAVTVDRTINFLRTAMALPLIATATPLRAGRPQFTAAVRMAEKITTRLAAKATGTYALSGATG